MAWTDVPDTDIDSGSPLKTGLMTDLRDNDIANASKPVYLAIDTNKTATTSYGAADQTIYAYCPEDASQLVCRFALWTASSGTATAKVLIKKTTGPAGSTYQEATSTATAKGAVGGSADKTVTITGLDNVSGDDLRGQAVTIEIYLKHSAGGQRVDAEATSWEPARWENA